MKLKELLRLLHVDGWFLVATGATLAEAEAATREAIAFHLEGLREDGSLIPLPSSRAEYVEVAA